MTATALSKRFGNAVRLRRTAAGLSQEKLAELANLHSTYIGMVERGLRNPTLDVAERLAFALNVGLPELLQEVQSQRPIRRRKG